MDGIAIGAAPDAGIPVVDLASPTAPKELLAASILNGFIFIKQQNCGLAQQSIDGMFDLSRRFFTSPDEVKAECIINSAKSGKNHGWLSMHQETLDPSNQKKGDFKEAFNIGSFQQGKPQQPLAGPLKASEAEIGVFMDDCHALCNCILTLLAAALDIPESDGGKDWFSHKHDHSIGQSGSILRLLHYPALPASVAVNPEEDIRAGAHSDYGSVTLLFRLPGQPGLEILTPSGDWAPVPVDPEPSQHSSVLPILVNLGDVLSFWTGGLLKSTVHRVIFPRPGQGPSGGADRYSIAYFCHPLDDARLVSIPSPAVQEHCRSSAGGLAPEVMTAREHLNSRLAATYGLT